MSSLNKPKAVKQHKTHGFRLSLVDVLFIVLGTIASYVAWDRISIFTYYIPFVIFHFFLFCNVFRVRRNYELIWAGIFLINNACWILGENLNIYTVFATQIPVSILFIVLEIRSDRYHGIFSKKPVIEESEKLNT